MNPGDTVMCGTRRAVLVELADVPTPSGGTVSVALIEYPRAGRTYVFRHLIQPVTDDPSQARPKLPVQEGFQLG